MAALSSWRHVLLWRQVFLLGTTPLPQWTRRVGGEDVERTIFHSINHALGIRCTRADPGRGRRWNLRPSRIVPIDRHAHGMRRTSRSVSRRTPHLADHPVSPARRRFAIVGPRRRDAIHPFFNAQFGVVQLMLNALCPLFGEGAQESEKQLVAEKLGWLKQQLGSSV